MLTQTPFDVARRPSFLALWSAAALLLCAGGLLLSPAANAQQNSPSPLEGEGRGEGATNNVSFDIPAQDLSDALSEYARQSGQDLLYRPEQASGRAAAAVEGSMTRAEAMRRLLAGTGLQFEFHHTGSMLVGDEATLEAYRRQLNSGASVAGQNQNTIGQRRPGIEEIIVTGQKREERIQDVPIAISAFTQEDLKVSQIAGGPDLHLQVPNMTFTKTNFTGYSIQIRGIGTQAISATTDPAVAVALNNTPFIRNRFFEQEFYDLERLEVLRGPQGTLYGRNATAGVVNLITAKPKFQHESMFSIDRGNYDSQRIEGMVNLPLVEDAVVLRIAGAATRRDGYATNEITENSIDGRDLWSTRVSLRVAPPDGNFDMNLIWEHFEEDDDRLRSGKQLCHKDVVTEVAGFETEYFQSLPEIGQGLLFAGVQGSFSTGCKRGSLYSEDAFQTPNGLVLGYYLPLGAIGLPEALRDPYATSDQSKDLRVIESALDPEYRARSDIGELQISYELTDTLTLDSETSYMTDEIFSFQDFNRFNTARGAWVQPNGNFRGLLPGPEGGVFCDPQLGCSDRLVAADVSSAESSHFSQEFRISSAFGGPFDFSLGANFLRYDTEDKYYVFANSFTLGALQQANRSAPYIPGESTNRECLRNGLLPQDPDRFYSVVGCQYIDPNPIGSLNDEGHNYFLSRNPYNLRSYAIFGETYFNFTDNLKLTAGLRWSVDKKTAPRIKTTLLVGDFAGSKEGHEVIEQEWREPTGRLVLDWKPTLDFTDETLVYGSYSHGYKAGGANPPTFTQSIYSADVEARAALTQRGTVQPRTFDAEFVDAFEVGTKNTLLDGALTLNLTGFYYDYENYQISELVERAAFNKNYDLTVRGLELEADLWATEKLRLGLKAGYQKTRIDNGEKAIDFMDRTAGGKHFFVTDAENTNFDPNAAPLPVEEYKAAKQFLEVDGERLPHYEDEDGNLLPLPAGQEFFAYDEWLVYKPFPTYASNCVLPAYLFQGVDSNGDPRLVNVGSKGGGGAGGCEIAYLAGADPVTRQAYEPDPDPSTYAQFLHGNEYPGWDPSTAPNFGEGFAKDLGGNELPNAPNYTVTLTADYIIPLRGDWIATAHTDIYWQDESYWRIFNDHEFSRLEPYFTMNLAAILSNDVSGWDIMAYIKNVTDEDAMTGAFLYTDDVGLTTNAFLVEPRLYGVRVTKHWDGDGPSEWLGHAGSALLGKAPGEPSPWALTVGGQMLRPKDDFNKTYEPDFISEFNPNIDPSRDQGKDLGWGDGREIVLTYAPDNGWRFSLGARFGESDRDDRSFFEGEIHQACGFAGTPPDNCPVYGYNYTMDRYDYGRSELTQTEEHLLIDFQVGREIGIGENLESVLSGGLRYAHFRSKADITLSGQPDWVLPTADFYFGKYTAQHTDYRANIQAEREFQGVGPVLAWDASMRLFGREESGRLDLDWSLSGGVLFGKQETEIEGFEESAYFDHGPEAKPPESVTYEAFRFERDDDSIETVPTVGAGLGLTYRLGGFAIGGGYHWERYFGAIDGGIEERKSYDRTIDGPYLKVTFGGGS